MSIASAFGQKKNESQVEEDEQDSDRESENPYMDDLDIAKEIYRSKGTTIPPTNHVFSRTLNTIPEDDIPTEVNIVETASNSNTDSTKSSPTKKALKFEDPFDENIFFCLNVPSKLFDFDTDLQYMTLTQIYKFTYICTSLNVHQFYFRALLFWGKKLLILFRYSWSFTWFDLF